MTMAALRDHRLFRGKRGEIFCKTVLKRTRLRLIIHCLFQLSVLTEGMYMLWISLRSKHMKSIFFFWNFQSFQGQNTFSAFSVFQWCLQVFKIPPPPSPLLATPRKQAAVCTRDCFGLVQSAECSSRQNQEGSFSSTLAMFWWRSLWCRQFWCCLFFHWLLDQAFL